MAEDGGKMRFKVFVRLRPTPPDASGNRNGIVKPEHKLLYLNDPSKGHSSEFVFDRVFGADSNQEEVFEEVGRGLVEHVLQGYNACCFAYGQTGSGKTYSMFGQEGGDWELRGVIPRACELLFKAASELQQSNSSVKLSFYVSFMELYLDQVRDLGAAAAAVLPHVSGPPGYNSGPQAHPQSLASLQAKLKRLDAADYINSNLDIQEDPSGLTFVKDLTFAEVSSVDDVMALLRAGYALRQTASTAQNDVSSRSHTVFTVSIVQYREGQQPITGRLNLVDLAGSERLSKSHSEGPRLAEAKAINTSLTALGKVVMSLSSEGGDRAHVPFRDSKLTRILKDSLKGNSFTTLLANLNPTQDNAEECFNTLQFAVRCSSISTAPHVNVVTQGGAQDGVVEQLMQQVAQLKEEVEYTHAHYQKLIESIAGPGWAKDLGPVERGEGSVDGGGSHVGSLTHDDEAAGGTSPPVAARRGVTLAEGTLSRSASSRSLAAGEAGARPSALSRQTTMAGAGMAAVRKLEAQLDGARGRLKEAEDRLTARRFELDEVRDKAAAKEHIQFNEIKKLRQQVAELTAKMADQSTEYRQKMDEARKRSEEEQSRLAAEAEGLRQQLASMTASIGGLMEGRSSRAKAEQRERDMLRAQAEAAARSQVAATASEKDRQINNLKQQSSYYLARKQEELEALRAELAGVRAEWAREAAALRQEAEYVAAYAERLTEVVNKVEAGQYTVTEKGGFRTFKVPPRDKPAHLDPARLTYLRTSVAAAERLLAAQGGATSHSLSAPSSPVPSTSIAAGPGPASHHSPAGAGPQGQPGAPGSTSTSSPGLPPRPPSATQLPPVPGSESGGPGSRSRPTSASTAGPPQSLPSHMPPAVDVETLRRSWETEYKSVLTAQVMAELRSDKTVEYIRALEEAVARYRKEVQQEKRRVNDANVALRSAQRSASRPGSGIQRGLAGDIISFPPSWGPGHGLNTVAMAAGLLTHRPGTAVSGSSRPVTVAAGMMRSSGTGLGSPRPMTSMAQLTAGFPEYGLGNF